MNASPRIAVISLLLLASCGASKEQYVQRGNAFFDKGQLAEADLQYRNALKQDANYAEAYYRLGLLLNKQSKATDALTTLEKAVTLQPNHNDARAALTKLYLEGLLYLPAPPQAFYDKLARIGQDYIKSDPKSFDGNRILGHLAMLDSKPGEAVSPLRTAHEAQPRSVEIATLLTQALLSSGKAAEAESFAQKTLAENPAHGPVYDILYGHYRTTNRPREAEDLLHKRIDVNPKESLAVLQLARHYQSLKQLPKRDETLAKLTGGGFPDGLIAAADFLRDNGEPQRASDLYQKGVQGDAAHAGDYQKRLVNLYLRTGQVKQAETILESILKANPADEEATAARASLRASSGQPAEIDTAIAAFTKLTAANPESASYRYDLGRALHLRGRDDDARTEFLRAIKTDPNHLPSLEELAGIAIQRANAQDAFTYSLRALSINPQLPRTRLVFTAALALQGKSAEARQQINALIREYPKLTEAHLQLALLNMQEQRYREAEAIYRQYYKPGQKDQRVLRGLVELGFASGQLERALEALQEEVRLQPSSNGARLMLATTAGRMNRSDIALEQFHWLKQNTPASAAVEIGLGLAHQQKQNWPEAVANFEAARRLAPKSPEAINALAYALQQSGKPGDAVPVYREALQLQPESLVLKNNLAMALIDSGGDLKEALQLAQSPASKDPANPVYADALGLVYLKRKETANAVQSFRSAVAKAADSVEYRIHLAQALIEAGNKADARAELDAALARKPSAAQSKEIAAIRTTHLK